MNKIELKIYNFALDDLLTFLEIKKFDEKHEEEFEKVEESIELLKLIREITSKEI